MQEPTNNMNEEEYFGESAEYFQQERKPANKDKESNRLEKLVRQGEEDKNQYRKGYRDALKYCRDCPALNEPVNFAGLEDKAAIFLELLNISGDTMVDLNHNVEEGKEGAMYLHDIMAAFVEDLSKISA